MERNEYRGYFLEDALFMANVGPIRLSANKLATVQFRDEPVTDKDVDIHEKFIVSELDESKRIADDPNTKVLTHEEVFGKLREKFGYDSDTEPNEADDEDAFSLAGVRKFKKNFNDRITYWQKFDDDWRELFTKKLRENIDFGKELYAALVSARWFHESDPNNTECSAGSGRSAGAFISSMLCYSDYIDWYLVEHSGKVSEGIADAMALRGWRYEIL